MRVLQIAPLYESVPPKLYGGTERVVDNLSRGLMAAGIDVTVMCSGDSTVPASIRAIWPEALRLSSRRIHDPTAYSVRTLALAAECADEFDIIHNHCDFSLLPLAQMTRRPVLSTIHNQINHNEDILIAFRSYPDAPLISISDSQRAPAPELNWIKTVLHGIDVRSFVFHETPGKYLAFIGRFSPEKRPDWAIDMALQSGIPLKMAAKISDTDREYYERVIKPRIDGKFIEYVGEISEREKSDFLGNALALAFPIDWAEPFGLVMVEALSCGTPVLARPCGSVPEVLVDGLTGFVRKSVSDLALLIEEASRLDRTQIRRYAEQRFSIERMTEEYLNAYNQLIVSNESPHTRRMAGHRRNFLYPVDGSFDRDSKSIA